MRLLTWFNFALASAGSMLVFASPIPLHAIVESSNSPLPNDRSSGQSFRNESPSSKRAPAVSRLGYADQADNPIYRTSFFSTSSKEGAGGMPKRELSELRAHPDLTAALKRRHPALLPLLTKLVPLVLAARPKLLAILELVFVLSKIFPKIAKTST